MQSRKPSVVIGIGKFTIEGLPGKVVRVPAEHMTKPA